MIYSATGQTSRKTEEIAEEEEEAAAEANKKNDSNENLCLI